MCVVCAGGDASVFVFFQPLLAINAIFRPKLSWPASYNMTLHLASTAVHAKPQSWGGGRYFRGVSPSFGSCCCVCPLPRMLSARELIIEAGQALEIRSEKSDHCWH